MSGYGVELSIVEGSDGLRVSFGPRQAHWLREGGFIERTDEQFIWRALHGLTGEEVHRLVLSQPDLRECDFCRASPAGWRINCRPFKLTLGSHAGARLGGEDRPMFACDVCVRYIRENRKAQLIDYVIASTVEYAKKAGGQVGDVAHSQPWPVIRRHLEPTVKEIVYGMFGHRQGRPIRDDNDAQEAA